MAKEMTKEATTDVNVDMAKENPEETNDFQKQLTRRLIGGQFRILNEKMYRNEELTPEQVKKYHELYSEQIKKWPVDPFKVVCDDLKVASKSKEIKVAELGCGDPSKYQTLENIKMDFYDKYPVDERVIRADMSSIGVPDETYDVAVCCLSLMMGDITDVVKEINRILKRGGLFIVAEVVSRMKETWQFTKEVEKYGFKMKKVVEKNKCFTVVRFEKSGPVVDKNRNRIKLGMCTYKKVVKKVKKSGRRSRK